MSSVDPAAHGWKKLGDSDNAEFFLAEDGVIAVVPHDGCTDDEATATQSVEFQHSYWRGEGRSGGALIFLDPIRDSQPGARGVYATLPDPSLIRGFALVGGSIFGRAIGSVFLGLSRPSAPTKMFGDKERGLAWLRERNRSA